MLLTRISQPPTQSPSPEDIFHSALTTIFTDDTVNSHGTPGSYITYSSPRFGDLELHIPAHPGVEDGRKLFAHYLWNAAVVAADGIESASKEDTKAEDGDSIITWNKRYWDVREKSVMELGAGTALPSLIAALSGAKACMITDHPSSPALTTGAIDKNVDVNLSQKKPYRDATRSQVDDDQNTQSIRSPRTDATVQVLGYTWGTSKFYLPTAYGKPAPPGSTPKHFDRIIVADCLWMPSQHINLIRTILQFLPLAVSEGKKEVSRQQDDGVSCALVVAGFHTGRSIVSQFFELATEPQAPPSAPAAPSSNHQEAPVDPSKVNTIPLSVSSLCDSDREVCGRLKLAEIYEIDVDGNTRAWAEQREGEGKWEAKRWCVVGVLIRA